MVPALVLLAVGAPGRLSPLFRLLVIAGVAVNAWGVVWWSRWWFRA